eukprot:tig00020601_g11720.t1
MALPPPSDGAAGGAGVSDRSADDERIAELIRLKPAERTGFFGGDVSAQQYFEETVAFLLEREHWYCRFPSLARELVYLYCWIGNAEVDKVFAEIASQLSRCTTCVDVYQSSQAEKQAALLEDFEEGQVQKFFADLAKYDEQRLLSELGRADDSATVAYPTALLGSPALYRAVGAWGKKSQVESVPLTIQGGRPLPGLLLLLVHPDVVVRAWADATLEEADPPPTGSEQLDAYEDAMDFLLATMSSDRFWVHRHGQAGAGPAPDAEWPLARCEFWAGFPSVLRRFDAAAVERLLSRHGALVDMASRAVRGDLFWSAARILRILLSAARAATWAQAGIRPRLLVSLLVERCEQPGCEAAVQNACMDLLPIVVSSISDGERGERRQQRAAALRFLLVNGPSAAFPSPSNAVALRLLRAGIDDDILDPDEDEDEAETAAAEVEHVAWCGPLVKLTCSLGSPLEPKELEQATDFLAATFASDGTALLSAALAAARGEEQRKPRLHWAAWEALCGPHPLVVHVDGVHPKILLAVVRAVSASAALSPADAAAAEALEAARGCAARLLSAVAARRSDVALDPLFRDPSGCLVALFAGAHGGCREAVSSVLLARHPNDVGSLAALRAYASAQPAAVRAGLVAAVEGAARAGPVNAARSLRSLFLALQHALPGLPDLETSGELLLKAAWRLAMECLACAASLRAAAPGAYEPVTVALLEGLREVLAAASRAEASPLLGDLAASFPRWAAPLARLGVQDSQPAIRRRWATVFADALELAARSLPGPLALPTPSSGGPADVLSDEQKYRLAELLPAVAEAARAPPSWANWPSRGSPAPQPPGPAPPALPPSSAATTTKRASSIPAPASPGPSTRGRSCCPRATPAPAPSKPLYPVFRVRPADQAGAAPPAPSGTAPSKPAAAVNNTFPPPESSFLRTRAHCAFGVQATCTPHPPPLARRRTSHGLPLRRPRPPPVAQASSSSSAATQPHDSRAGLPAGRSEAAHPAPPARAAFNLSDVIADTVALASSIPPAPPRDRPPPPPRAPPPAPAPQRDPSAAAAARKRTPSPESRRADTASPEPWISPAPAPQPANDREHQTAQPFVRGSSPGAQQAAARGPTPPPEMEEGEWAEDAEAEAEAAKHRARARELAAAAVRKPDRRPAKMMNLEEVGVRQTDLQSARHSRLDQERDVASRLKPTLDTLHRTVLSWGLSEIRQEAPVQPLKPVPRSFPPSMPTAPLQTAEREGDDGDGAALQAKLRSVDRVDSFHFATLQLRTVPQGSASLTDHDVVLLTEDTAAARDDALTCLARRAEVERVELPANPAGGRGPRADPRAVRLKLYLDRSGYGVDRRQVMLQRLRVDSRWRLRKLHNLVTVHREYQALLSARHLTLLPHILDPAKHPPVLSPPPAAGSASILPAPFRNQIDKEFNESQRRAILHVGTSLSRGFCLLQGPPGTGKTRTVVAVISALLMRAAAQRVGPNAAPAAVAAAMLPAPDLSNPDMARTESLPRFGASQSGPAARILVCAPSNAAIDELVSRLCAGLPGPDGKNLVPPRGTVIRLGVPQGGSPGPVHIETLVEEAISGTAAQSSTEGMPSVEQLEMELAAAQEAFSADIALLQRLNEALAGPGNAAPPELTAEEKTDDTLGRQGDNKQLLPMSERAAACRRRLDSTRAHKEHAPFGQVVREDAEWAGGGGGAGPEAAERARAGFERLRAEGRVCAGELRELAASSGLRSGKWLLFATPAQVDEWWAKVARGVARGQLGPAAKVAPRGGQRVICAYTADCLDEPDVRRVREALRALGFAGTLRYKADLYTALEIYAENPWGLPVSMYSL